MEPSRQRDLYELQSEAMKHAEEMNFITTNITSLHLMEHESEATLYETFKYINLTD